MVRAHFSFFSSEPACCGASPVRPTQEEGFADSQGGARMGNSSAYEIALMDVTEGTSKCLVPNPSDDEGVTIPYWGRWSCRADDQPFVADSLGPFRTEMLQSL
jgi:hypothetical protein